ncbi:MAG: hypothetical protein V9E87_05845 [Gemmatimonadales bacterium]
MPRRLLAALLLLPAALPAQGAKLEARAYALLGPRGDTIAVERWLALGGAIRAEQRSDGARRSRCGSGSTRTPKPLLERLTLIRGPIGRRRAVRGRLRARRRLGACRQRGPPGGPT